VEKQEVRVSGASESNEDLVSGRVNRSNDQTSVWAENGAVTDPILPVGSTPVAYKGGNILVASVSPDVNNDYRPSTPLNAILGNGWMGGTGVTGNGGAAGGTGVHGLGGANGVGVMGDGNRAGAGVIGRGGPLVGTGVLGIGSLGGSAGVGVQGVGGIANIGGPPAAGVFGQGGTISGTNTDRRLLGAGVIGVGGDAGSAPASPPADAGSVGVFGQGADAKVDSTPGPGGTPVLSGPLEPGAGIIGRGGVPVPPSPRMQMAAGVIGLAGGEDKPSLSQTGNVGVFGQGPTGVRGRGKAGPGINGSSSADRGGVFSSAQAAQARLVPHGIEIELPSGVPVTPTGIGESHLERGVVLLPKDGFAGDLMTLRDSAGNCTLWFCVRSADANGPARWSQVLLGPSFYGQ
jgi:hypothetical protein